MLILPRKIFNASYTTNLEPNNPPKTNRKKPLEKQPKQTFKLNKINSSNSLFNSSGGKSKVTPREEVFIHVESSHKTNSKLRSPNVHLKDSKKRDFSTPKGLSFGLLAKKNAKDKKMKIHKQDQFDDSPKIEARRPVRTLLDAMPSPNNFRKSQDVQVYSSFRDHTEKDPTISVHKIDPKPFESSHNLQFGKMKKEIIRITPLQERRSQTRRLRASTITREEGAKPMKNSISLVSPNVEPEDKDIVNFTAIRPEKEAIKVIEVEENEQISTYSLFTKIITGALERLGGDDQLQLACLEECKNIIKLKNKDKKKSISKMHGSKLKSHLKKPLDQKQAAQNYEIIKTELENEYNDLLITE